MAEQIEVDMIVEAISKGFEKLSGDVKKVDTSSDKLTQTLDKTDKGLKKVTDRTQAFQSAAKIGFGAIMGFAAGIKKLADKAVEYGDHVRDVQRALGGTSEEASRLIQVADDVYISYETMSLAMKNAQRKGITPNIEGLKKLADQYLAIQDPTERAQFLLENFGKSGLEMGKLLEKGSDGIDKLNQGIADGLILTDDALKKMDDYKKAMDDFGDSTEAVSIILALKFLPALTDALNQIAKGTGSTKEYYQAQVLTVQALAKGTITYKEYLEIMLGMFTRHVDARDVINLFTKAVMGGTAAVKEETKAITEQEPKIQDLEKATKSLTKAGDYQRRNQRLRFDEDDIQRRREQIEEAKKQLEDLTKKKYQAKLDLEMTIKDVSKSLGDQINSAIDSVVKSKDLEMSLKSITDKIFGTDAVRQANLDEKISAALNEAIKTGDLTKFEEAMKAIYQWIVPTDETVKAAQAQLKIIEDEITTLQTMPKRYDVYVYTHFINTGTSGTGGGAGGGGSNPNERIGGESYKTGAQFAGTGGQGTAGAAGASAMLAALVSILSGQQGRQINAARRSGRSIYSGS